MKTMLVNGPYVETKAVASGHIVTVTVKNHDPQAIGIAEATFTMRCSNPTEASEWLAYFYRDFDYEIEVKTTYKE
jgi:hypothetical protein